jgi:hypothetical protein
MEAGWRGYPYPILKASSLSSSGWQWMWKASWRCGVENRHESTDETREWDYHIRICNLTITELCKTLLISTLTFLFELLGFPRASILQTKTAHMPGVSFLFFCSSY